VPLAALEGLAGRADVSFVKPAVRAKTHVGTYTSQGDVTMRADAFRSTLKATGRGIKVGVLSDSIYHLVSSQSTGDLGPVTVLPGQDGVTSQSTGEGTAML
jgi:hypothetical protein